MDMCNSNSTTVHFSLQILAHYLLMSVQGQLSIILQLQHTCVGHDPLTEIYTIFCLNSHLHVNGCNFSDIVVLYTVSIKTVLSFIPTAASSIKGICLYSTTLKMTVDSTSGMLYTVNSFQTIECPA